MATGPWNRYRGMTQQNQAMQIAPPDPRAPFQTERERIGVQADQESIRTELLRQQQITGQIQAQQRELAGQSPLPPGERSDLSGTFNSLNNLERGIDELGTIYNRGFRGRRNPAEYLPGSIRPDNALLNDAGSRLSAFIANALELTGQQFNTPREQQLFINSYLPSNTDRDEQIEAKIGALTDLLNNARRSMSGRLGQEFQEYQNPLFRAPPGEQADRTPITALPGGQGGQMQISTTEQTVTNPALSGLNQRIDGFARNGAPVGEVARFLRERGLDTPAIVDITNQYRRLQAWRRQNPNYEGPFQIDVERYEEQLDPLARSAAEISSGPVGAFGMSAGQAVTGNRLDDAVGFFGGDSELARAGMAGVREQNPFSSLAGDIAGQGLAMYGAGGIGRAAASRLPAATQAGVNAAINPFTRTAGRRGLTADAAYGAFAGSGDDDVLGGVAYNVAGGALGSAATRGAGRVIGGARDLAVRDLTDRGFPLTVGQIAGQGGLAGRTIRGIEQRAAGFPVIGDMIGGQYRQGLEAGVQAAHQEVLDQIGQQAGPQVGEEAVDATLGRINQAFRDATRGVNLHRDRQFNAQFRSAIMAGRRRAVPPEQRAVVDAAMTQIGELFENNNMTGENLQAALQILGEARSAVAGQPLSRSSLASLRQAEQALVNMTRRQSPQTMPALNRARQAYRRFAVVRDATRSARNDAEGIFTPAQLNAADVNNTTNFGGRNASASTQRPFFDLTNSLRQVLPNRVPDSGTAGRSALGVGALLGAGAGSDAVGLTEDGTGVALGLAAAAPYTNLGRRAFQTALVRRPEMARQAGDFLLDNEWVQRISRLIGASQLPYQTIERY